MTIEEYVRKDGRKLNDAEMALFRGAEKAWKSRMDCHRYGRAGESLYMAIQSAFLDAIQTVPDLWQAWEDYNEKSL